MTVPPDRVWVGDGRAPALRRHGQSARHYHTTGRALREIGDVLRNGTLTDSRKVSAIAAVMANGPLDDAPGGPCEDAAFAARREAFREAVEALREDAVPERKGFELEVARVVLAQAADFLERRLLTSEGEDDGPDRGRTTSDA